MTVLQSTGKWSPCLFWWAPWSHPPASRTYTSDTEEQTGSSIRAPVAALALFTFLPCFYSDSPVIALPASFSTSVLTTSLDLTLGITLLVIGLSFLDKWVYFFIQPLGLEATSYKHSLCLSLSWGPSTLALSFRFIRSQEQLGALPVQTLRVVQVQILLVSCLLWEVFSAISNCLNGKMKYPAPPPTKFYSL